MERTKSNPSLNLQRGLVDTSSHEGGTVQLAVALFDYTAVEADEISLLRGENIVVYGSPEEGWYECELRGRVGMVPANYVRLLHKAGLRHDAPANATVANVANEWRRLGSSNDENIVANTSIGVYSKANNTMGPNSAQGRSSEVQDFGLRERSDETLNRRRQVYERLYHQGVVKVKRQQHMQEQKRLEEREILRKDRQQVNVKSMKMSAARKPDQGTNYGSFLYHEGIERRDIKEEQMRQIKQNEHMEEEKETTFTPLISKTSKRLRRDMPVVERLFMLEQVKAEKIETLKQARNMAESRQATFTPQINHSYALKEGQRTQLDQSHLDFQKKESKRKSMQEKLDREQGVTHKPMLSHRTRQLAEQAAGRAPVAQDANIFDRLYKEAEERELKYQVKQIEAHLMSLDLASYQTVTLPFQPKALGKRKR